MIELLAAAMLQQQGPWDVFEAHDREPAGLHRGLGHEKQAGDDECHEQHHLLPDGDHDCDDPVGVAEPAPFDLMLAGLGGLGLVVVWRRRR
jgi:MYXO-CTERM domain-containing protein